jgi:predicted nucleic acid-binding protein
LRVLLDASALVPLALERDQWVLQVRRHLRALRAGPAPTLVTTYWTYYEALGICRRASSLVVRKLRLTVETDLTVVPVSEAAVAEALRRFFAWQDKTASVVDHANLLMAQALGCQAILTFDDDFLPIAHGTGIRILN